MDSTQIHVTSSGCSALLEADSQAAKILGAEAVEENQMIAEAEKQLLDFYQTNPPQDAETGDAAAPAAEEMK